MRHSAVKSFLLLSPGQTDRQVSASGRQLNLRTDLRWVAKETRKFPRKYTQLAKKDILRRTIFYFNHWLIILMDVTPLALTWFGWPYSEKGTLTCERI